MAIKKAISTDQAPAAIGTYSQAVQVDNMVYISGQIPLDPSTMDVISDDAEKQIQQVFKNLSAVAAAAGGHFEDMVKLTIYLTDLSLFPKVNEIMATHFQEPYPARAAVEVSALPRGVLVEVDAIMALS